MLKTYRIIPLVFIFFLFGFTLVTVAPVLAEDSPEFVACQQIKPSGDFQLLKEKKNCFRDVAIALHAKALELESNLGELQVMRSNKEDQLLRKSNEDSRRLVALNAELSRRPQFEQDAINRMMSLREEVKHHYCSRMAEYLTRGTLSDTVRKFGNGFMRIIGADMRNC